VSEKGTGKNIRSREPVKRRAETVRERGVNDRITGIIPGVCSGEGQGDVPRTEKKGEEK